MIILQKLYQMNNPSGREQKVSKAVQMILKSKGVKFNVDKHGQVFYFKKNTALVSCHMDSVFSKAPAYVMRKKGCYYGLDKSGDFCGLGADDKNGIWIALKLIGCFRNDISFIFSVEEENGGSQFSSLMKKNTKVLESMKYSIVLDRKGSGDIIGSYNSYCNETFEDDVAEIGEHHNYCPSTGLFSDADTIAQYLNTVNLSVGYYNPHSKTEYTCIEHLYNAYKFSKKIITKLDKSYGIPEFCRDNRYNRGEFYSTSWRDEECYGNTTEWSNEAQDWVLKKGTHSHLINEQDAWENGCYCPSCGQDFLSTDDVCMLFEDNWRCCFCGDVVAAYGLNVSEYMPNKSKVIEGVQP